MRLDQLNALDEDAAVHVLLRCCGSSRWARRMAAARPFADESSLDDAAETLWWALDHADWLEAFAAHPKIGETRAGGAGQAGGAGPAGWSQVEQAGVAGAGDETRRRLAEGNREYEARFGYIFIVCATGKTASEMLALLEGRLRHDAGDELRIASQEQQKITRLRLEKLLTPEPDTIP